MFVGRIINKYCIHSFMLHQVKDTYSGILANYPALYWLLNLKGSFAPCFHCLSLMLLQTFLLSTSWMTHYIFVIIHHLWEGFRLELLEYLKPCNKKKSVLFYTVALFICRWRKKVALSRKLIKMKVIRRKKNTNAL